MRAVTVEVDSMSGVAGFIRQNDRVDILVTIDIPDITATTTSTKIITNVIAENIQVLAVGETIGTSTSEDGTDTTTTYTTITLVAAPEIAERIVFAQAEGRISLILRSVTDEVTEKDTPVDRSDVEGW
jgi:pilus assembly protein CpaB